MYNGYLIESGTPHSLRTRKAEPRLAGVPLISALLWVFSDYGKYCSTIEVMVSPSTVYQTHRPAEYQSLGLEPL